MKMKQTEVGLIPDDWEVKTLGEIGEPCMCKRILKEQTSPTGDIPFYKIGTFGGIPDAFISRDLFEQYKEQYNYPRKGTLLLSAAGTIGRVVVFDGKDSYFQDSNIVWIDNDETKVTNDFLFYCYSRMQWKTEEGGIVSRLYNANLKSTSFIAPKSLAEQQRIAKALSDVDALISTTEKLLQKKKNINQGAMQNLLTGKKRLPGFGPQTKSPTYKQTELGPIPDDWEVKKLSEFGTFSKGSGISREESNTGEYPAVRYGELYTTHNDYIKSFYSHISYEVASKSKKINKGDLLFTCSGETKEDIGKCVAFIGNEKAYAGGDLLILSPTVNIDSLFYGFLLNTTVAVKQKSSMAQGDAVVHISAESIGKIRVPFPSKEEQTAIANVLSSMDKEIETLNTKLEKYRNLKTAMMQQLLTGKIRLV